MPWKCSAVSGPEWAPCRCQLLLQKVPARMSGTKRLFCSYYYTRLNKRLKIAICHPFVIYHLYLEQGKSDRVCMILWLAYIETRENLFYFVPLKWYFFLTVYRANPSPCVWLQTVTKEMLNKFMPIHGSSGRRMIWHFPFFCRLKESVCTLHVKCLPCFFFLASGESFNRNRHLHFTGYET